MAEPEISHRCMACGAAIRAHAQFCPQCGKQVKKAASDSLPAAKASEVQPSGRIDRELKTTPLAPAPTVVEPAQQQDATPNAESQTTREDAQEVSPAAAKHEKHAKKNRVKQAARGVVQENVRPRVEKLRKASNVVIEEVAIDPSLRFILIAVFIFIVFITLLLLSFIK